MEAEVWTGWLTYTDARGQEHRILAVEHGWKLRIQDRMTGRLIHEENRCPTLAEAMKRDEAWGKVHSG